MPKFDAQYIPVGGGWPIKHRKIKAKDFTAAVEKAKKEIGPGHLIIVKSKMGERHAQDT